MDFVDNYQGSPNGSAYSGGISLMGRVAMGDANWRRLRRPYFDKHGRPSVTVNTGRTTLVKGEQVPILEHRLIRDIVNNSGIMLPVFNATTLRKEEWIELDRVVLREARFRMRAWSDLASANSFGGFNGMNKLILEHETMNDPGEAIVDMDGLTPGRSDAPKFQLEGLPLPITHSDFWFPARQLGISRNTGTPLDTTMGEAAGRRIAESLEKVTIGTETGVVYGGNSTQVGGYGRTSQVYGYMTFPQRLTSVTGYIPSNSTTGGRSGSGWVPQDSLLDVLSMLQAIRLNKFFGPFMLYHSNDWDQYLDRDYILVGGATVSTQTLRKRLLAIGKEDDTQIGPAAGQGNVILGVRRLDFLTSAEVSSSDAAYPMGTHPFRMLLIQMTQDVCRAVNGMDITTIQWESVGGMRVNFKCLCIQVPQLRASQAGKCGIMDTIFST